MAIVHSIWANHPIEPTGILTSPEWRDAGCMPIPGGVLMVLNDATYLYLALDLVRDHRDDPTEDDYFWFSVDVGRDGQISPYRDVNFAPYPISEGLRVLGDAAGHSRRRIGRKQYIGPSCWTGFVDDPVPTYAGLGFAQSPNSPDSHRIWEMRLRLRDMDVAVGGAAPVVRFGLRIASLSSTFTFDYPPNFASDFSSLHEIHLAAPPRSW